MKDFRKNEQGHLICEECNHVFINCRELSKHIKNKHCEQKKYFDKWIKDIDDGICKICKNETKFIGLLGYQDCCCKKCKDKYCHQQSVKGNLLKYEVENSFQSKEIKEKIKKIKEEKYGDENYNNRGKFKETCFETYGVECYFQSEEIKEKSKQTKKERYNNENYTNRKKSKQTCLEKYGVENPQQNKNVQEKTKQTCFKKYGVEYVSQVLEIKIKRENTSLKRYGVKYPNQNRDQFEKGFKTRLQLHYFNANLWYQSSFELDFLEKYYDKFPDIQRGPSIKYQLNGKDKVYHPDFYISSLNLVVEIKNSWLAERDKDKIEAKRKATINSGFKYIMIIDKDYSKLFSYTI